MTNEIVLDLDPAKDNPRNSEGAFAQLSDGRLIFAYSRFCGGSTDHSQADIVARFSNDGGCTWTTEDAVIVKNESKQNVMSVSLLPMRDGTLGLFHARKNDLHDNRVWLRRSADDGRTWSEPSLVVQAPGYFVLNNDRAVRLTSGRIVAPVAYHRAKRDTHGEMNYAAFDSRGIILYYLSDDDGATWRESADWWAMPLSEGGGLQEPGVVELKDGRLWSWCRTTLGQQWSLWSNDGGETWSQPIPSKIMSPCSPASVKRIPSTQDLLMVWNDHDRIADRELWTSDDAQPEIPPLAPQAGSAGRTPLVSGISQDEGKTWVHRRCLESSPQHGFCYTAIFFLDDAVLLAYCAGGLETKGLLNRLRIRRVSIDWLYAATAPER